MPGFSPLSEADLEGLFLGVALGVPDGREFATGGPETVGIGFQGFLGDIALVTAVVEAIAGADEDVVDEGCADVLGLDFRDGSEGVLPAGEDVVAHDIFPGVVDIEGGILGVVHEVVLNEDVGGAFVEIDAPTAVVVGTDVVDVVAANDGAGLDAEGIDAAHVAEHAAADVVDVVVLDTIVA